MKITATAQDFSLPIPIFHEYIIGEAATDDSGDFFVVAGLSPDHVATLSARSFDTTDEVLQKYTSDYERFGIGSYEKWYAKNRVPFALITKKTGELAALIWFGPKPLGRRPIKRLSAAELNVDERTLDSGEWDTVSFRSYPPFRGKNLMVDFFTFVTDLWHTKHSGRRIWFGVEKKNAAGIGFAKKLGFVEDPRHEDTEWAVFIDNPKEA